MFFRDCCFHLIDDKKELNLLIKCECLDHKFQKELSMKILNNTSLESKKRVKINFSGGELSSDAGLLLIKEFAAKTGLIRLKLLKIVAIHER